MNYKLIIEPSSEGTEGNFADGDYNARQEGSLGDIYDPRVKKRIEELLEHIPASGMRRLTLKIE